MSKELLNSEYKHVVSKIDMHAEEVEFYLGMLKTYVKYE